jgi:hypothetical protein
LHLPIFLFNFVDTFNAMKKIIFRTAVVLLSFTGILTSCNKSGQNQNPVLPGDVMLSYLVTTFSSATGGINSQIDSAIQCSNRGYKLDTTYNLDYTLAESDSSSSIHYSYNTHYHFHKSQSPSPMFDFLYSADGTCETQDVSVSENSTANYVITGLEPSDPAYLMAGSGNQGGSETSKHDKSTFTFILTYDINLQIPKAAQISYAGIANITISARGPGNESFNGTVKLTFLSGWATFSYNGVGYTFNVLTGKTH